MLKTTDNNIGQPANWQDDGYDDTKKPVYEHQVNWEGLSFTVKTDGDCNVEELICHDDPIQVLELMYMFKADEDLHTAVSRATGCDHNSRTEVSYEL